MEKIKSFTPIICPIPRRPCAFQIAQNCGSSVKSVSKSKIIRFTNNKGCPNLVGGCASSLEQLAQIKVDEDFALCDIANAEKEMRIRSFSLTANKCKTISRKEVANGRNSFPMMANEVLAPERPTNPLARDSFFSLRGAELNDNDEFSFSYNIKE